MSIRMFAMPVIVLMLSGCATPPATPPSGTACSADAVKSFVGRAATEDVVNDARSAAGAELLRVIKPGQAVTMDYRVERLNLYLDEAGAIERVSCG